MDTLPQTSSIETWLACYGMGNGLRTKNGRRMASEMASSDFCGGGGFQNGRNMARQMTGIGRKSPNVSCPAPAIFQQFWEPAPREIAAGHFAGSIFRPFWVLGPLPILQQASQVSIEALQAAVCRSLPALTRARNHRKLPFWASMKLL